MADEATTMTVPTGSPAPSAETSAPTAAGSVPSDGVQAATEQQPQEATQGGEARSEPGKPDYRRQYQDDPEFRAFVKSESDRLAQQRLARERNAREREELAKAKDDPTRALEYAQTRHRTLEQEAIASQPVEQANQMLESFARNRTWAEEYNNLRATDPNFHAEYAKDPVGFMERVDERITEILIDRKAAEKAKVLAQALATEQTNRALANLPVPPTGSGASGDTLLLDRFNRMSPSERRSYYREHEKEINEAEGRRVKEVLGR